MGASRNVLAIIAVFLLFTTSIATEPVERTSNQGYGLTFDPNAFGCPTNTIDCDQTDVVLTEPSVLVGSFREYAALQVRMPGSGHGCCFTLHLSFLLSLQFIKANNYNPSDSDCTSAVTSTPSCANSSWGLYDATSGTTPASELGDGGADLFCCDVGFVGIEEGAECLSVHVVPHRNFNTGNFYSVFGPNAF
jgi:hypothetical protein